MLSLQLRSAATDGDFAQLDKLLRKVGVTDRDEEAFTPLHYAAWAGHDQLLAKLLETISSGKFNTSPQELVNARNDSGQTPLHLAAGYGRLEATRALLRHGAAVNVRDTVGYTPMHLAAEGQWGVTGWEGTGGRKSTHADVIRVLLASGGDATLQDKFGRTCLDVAANNQEIRLLLQRAVVDETRRREAVEMPLTVDSGPEAWDPEGVAAWFTRLGLGQYAAIIKEKVVSGKMLLRMTEEKLSRLVPDEFHRERILEELEQLRNQRTPVLLQDDTVISATPPTPMLSLKGTVRTTVNIDNTSPFDVKVYHVDEQGQEQLKRILSAGETFSEPTMEGALFHVVRDRDGVSIGYLRVGKQPAWMSLLNLVASRGSSLPSYEEATLF